jgi:hypothetical protein
VARATQVFVADDESPPLTRFESWIEEIVRKEHDSVPPNGAEPLDLGELEGALGAG